MITSRVPKLVGVACAALLALAVAPAAAQPAQVVTVRVDVDKPGRIIPDDFVGLSFEADQLHRGWTDPGRGNVAALLSNLGTGNMRFSANQVDNTAWTPNASAPAPDWADGKRITPGDLTRLNSLAESIGWSVDLGVNLGHYDPAAAADQVVAARDTLGDSLRTVQIGNEPNFYLLSAASGDRKAYTPQTYVPDVRAYRKAIKRAAPEVRIEGPDVVFPAVGLDALDPVMQSTVAEPWIETYISAFGAQSRYLNEHHYPFVNVERVGIPRPVAEGLNSLPTVDRLLDPATTAKQTAYLRQFAARAKRAGLTPMLTETNSAAKEGRPGVTNSFGGALWTVDYLMTAAREGIGGVNLHTQMDDCGSYSVICFPNQKARKAARAHANPNYYAALMASQMSGGAVLPVKVSSGGTHITAHAVRMPDGRVQVIVDDLDRSFRGTVRVELVGDDAGTATVQRLTASSPDATGGTRLAGATVGPDGRFTPGADETLTASDGRFAVRFQRPGAVLLTAG